MVTRKLWRAVNSPPPRSPIYLRAFASRFHTEERRPFHVPLLRQITAISKDLGVLVLPIVLILFGTPFLILLFYIALLISPLLLPLANTVHGLAHAISASSGIARERDRQTYDVLCATPPGMLGMHWSYCTGWLYDHSSFRTPLLGVLVIGIIANVVGITSQVIFGGDGAPPLTIMVRGLALSAIFIIDYTQTIIVSSLTVLLVPTSGENESNTRLRAAGMFLTLQMCVYLPTLLVAVVALPGTFRLIHVDPATGALISPLLYLAFFVALREIIIVGLWRRVEINLNATRVELDAITQAAV